MLAEDMLFLAAANILAHFDVSNARSFDGSEPRWEGSIIWYGPLIACEGSRGSIMISSAILYRSSALSSLA